MKSIEYNDKLLYIFVGWNIKVLYVDLYLIYNCF